MEIHPCKTNHTHVGIDLLENALRKENQPDGKADEQNARRTLRRSEKESSEGVHLCSSFLLGILRHTYDLSESLPQRYLEEFIPYDDVKLAVETKHPRVV